jgi:hypothetical protein
MRRSPPEEPRWGCGDYRLGPAEHTEGDSEPEGPDQDGHPEHIGDPSGALSLAVKGSHRGSLPPAAGKCDDQVVPLGEGSQECVPFCLKRS